MSSHLLCIVYASVLGLAAGGLSSEQQHSAGSAPGDSIADMRKSLFQFWLQHGPDEQYGGFHGTVDRQGSPISPTNKTLVQQARHLWALTALLSSGKQSESAAAARSAADSLFNFLKKHMLTQVSLGSKGATGRAFVCSVSRDGNTVADPSINVYANAFAIYGLSKYARVTGSSEALKLALDTIRTLDALYHSTITGGYDESGTVGGTVFDSVALPGTNSAGKPQLSQSFNTLMHMAEALTELSRATKGSDALVQDRLLEHLKLMTGRLVVQPDAITASIALSYDPRNWSPVVKQPIWVNYGHNIEASWLMADGVDQLQCTGLISSSTAQQMKSVLLKLGTTGVRLGYDSTYGGVYDGGAIQKSTPGNKTFWVQAEAFLALDWSHKQTGEKQYTDKLYNTLQFVKGSMWDWKYGDWYWKVPRQGGKPLDYVAGGLPYNAGVKGNAWKASYHVGRSLLALEAKGY